MIYKRLEEQPNLLTSTPWTTNVAHRCGCRKAGSLKFQMRSLFWLTWPITPPLSKPFRVWILWYIWVRTPEGESWDSLLNSNIIGTYNIFETGKQAGVRRIVAASSIMISQGHREQEPYRVMWARRHADIPPNVPLISPVIPAEPRGLYAATKVWSESLARVYAHRHNISCICIRIGQVERDRPRPPDGADIYVSQRDVVQMFERAVKAPVI